MPTSQTWSTLTLVALMIVAFYFLIIRPQRKRAQQQQQTMNQITPGTRVMLGSGLFGTVVSVGEKQMVLEISPGAQLTVLKQAIGRVVQPSDEDDYAPDEDEELEPSSFDLQQPTVEPVRSTQPATPVATTDATSVTSQPAPETVGEPESRGGTAKPKE